MNLSLVPALALFALVSSITPGPNNLMLMASGANFGLRRTLPHMMGIAIGFVVMLGLVGLGLIRLFDAFPVIHQILRLFSLIYILFLAWKISQAAPPRGSVQSGQPMTFFQAALFQWVNPKAWAMSLTAMTAYAPDNSLLAIAIVCLVFGLINLPSIGLWTLMGRALRGFLGHDRRLRLFNWTMATLLILSVVPIALA